MSNGVPVENNAKPDIRRDPLEQAFGQIRSQGGLTSSLSGKTYTPEYLEGRSNAYFNGEVPINQLPRGTAEIPLRELVWQKTAQDAQSQIQENLATLNGKEYNTIMGEESMGGNAGYWSWKEKGIKNLPCQGINVWFNGEGKIVAVGNIQDLSNTEREMIKTGRLERATMLQPFPFSEPNISDQIVKIFFDENPDRLFKPQVILTESVRRHNEIEAQKYGTPLVDPTQEVGSRS